MSTIYQKANAAMRAEIKRYLALAERTSSFKWVEEEHLADPLDQQMFASGLGLYATNAEELVPEGLVAEWKRKSAVPFDIESSVTIGVYREIRPFANRLYDEAAQLTNGFSIFEADKLFANPHLLPILQHLSGVFSKASLKKEVGSVSDTGFSRPASERLADLLANRVKPEAVTKENILQRMEPTLEGIVRDLVGRVLLEEIVAEALRGESVPFLREDEYSALTGSVYDFRADFVIPDEKRPVAFIEVRKSSSRHASLYAKDKMFSAINWKGHHHQLIGIIIVDGDWTQVTLQTMAKVFDYVVPLHESPFMAKILSRACAGDTTVLKWLLEFRIKENPEFKQSSYKSLH